MSVKSIIIKIIGLVKLSYQFVLLIMFLIGINVLSKLLFGKINVKYICFTQFVEY